MAGLHPVHESECGQIPAQLFCCSGGRWWTPPCPSWGFVLVSFTGVVLLSINNHWSRSCSWWPYGELSKLWAALGVSWVFGKLLLKELGFVMIRRGEERVNCQEAAGKWHSWIPLCSGNWSHLCWGPDAERGHWEHFAAPQGSPLGMVSAGCPEAALLHKSSGAPAAALWAGLWAARPCREVFPQGWALHCVCCTTCILQQECFLTAAHGS